MRAHPAREGQEESRVGLPKLLFLVYIPFVSNTLIQMWAHAHDRFCNVHTLFYLELQVSVLTPRRKKADLEWAPFD